MYDYLVFYYQTFFAPIFNKKFIWVGLISTLFISTAETNDNVANN